MIKRSSSIDIRDVARAFYYLALKSRKGGIYNICSGTPQTIKQILDTLLNLSHAHIKVVTDPALIRQKDISMMFGSNQKIKDDIGWKPEISLKDSLKETLDYYRK